MTGPISPTVWSACVPTTCVPTIGVSSPATPDEATERTAGERGERGADMQWAQAYFTYGS